jgi:tetratricopeptide (TPR) repeat protein
MESKKQFYFFLCVSVPVVFFYLLLRNNAVGTATQSSAGLIGQVSLATRLINTPAIIVFYLGNFIYPFKLATFYQWVYKTPDLWHFWTPLLVSILFVLGIVNFAWIIHKKYSQEDLKIYLFFVCWFFLGIGLHLQIFPLDATVADRWFYFPIAGLLGMLGLLLKIYKVNFRNKNAITLTLIVLTILAMRTFVRSFNWRDNLRLALNDVEISKEAYGLENVIAVEFLKQGRFEEAKVYAERSIVIYPNTQNYNTLGLIDFWLGDYPKAKENYLKALSFGDRYKVYDNLARLGLVYGNSKESVEFIRSALKKFPKDYELWLYLSVLEYEQGDIQQARTDVSIAYGLDKSKETVTIYNNVMRGEKLDLEFTLGPDWKK